MLKITITLATVALVGTSPAFARDRIKAPVLATSVAASGVGASGVEVAAVSDRQRYCIVETPTGSHIQKKVCKSRAEWLGEGFDPIARQ